MIRVHAPNQAKLKRLRLSEHELVFDALGWANADHLTPDELNRLRKFHFLIETLEEPEDEIVMLSEEADEEAEQVEEEPETAPLFAGTPTKSKRSNATKKRGE